MMYRKACEAYSGANFAAEGMVESLWKLCNETQDLKWRYPKKTVHFLVLGKSIAMGAETWCTFDLLAES
jgi:hypothetical protein